MTALLYLDDQTARTFEATVERALDDRVVLDRTLFYPTGGGQPHDTGTLETPDGDRSWRVTGVAKGDAVYHSLDAEPPAAGTAVVGRLDWDRRYAHMRYHTAQHLLSAVLLDDYDAATTGNQLYADRARIDCAHDRFGPGDLEAIERAVNDLVDEAIPVRTFTMDRAEAEAELDPERTRFDLLPESITELRIVEVGGYDRTACAGTHVARTDECGAFELTGRETKGANEERLSFELSPD